MNVEDRLRGLEELAQIQSQINNSNIEVLSRHHDKIRALAESLITTIMVVRKMVDKVDWDSPDKPDFDLGDIDDILGRFGDGFENN